MEWGRSSRYGKEGSFGMGYFSLPHDISLNEKLHQVYVADRENGRVQVSKKGLFVLHNKCVPSGL